MVWVRLLFEILKKEIEDELDSEKKKKKGRRKKKMLGKEGEYLYYC